MQLSVCANASLPRLSFLFSYSPLSPLFCPALPCPASIRSESLSRDAGITTYQADDKHSSVKNSGMCTTTLHVCSLNRGGRGHKGRVAVMCMHVRTHTYIYTYAYIRIQKVRWRSLPSFTYSASPRVLAPTPFLSHFALRRIS
mmetsp:Transcript_30897/g.81105  ORF Transcript_30897/g.81105 Transcript_30897/m.81105 type:complete len:143 (-) Transcript_30897:2062-2490(-)